MKVLTILGTRPEIIRLSHIIGGLDKVCDNFILHTGQNYDHGLNKIFFDELDVRQPDKVLDARGTFSEQVSAIFKGVEEVIQEIQPDKCLILGDTNSGLSAVVAKRMGVPVYHMEAGNRCYDDKVPEEVNRRVIDQCSDVLLPYTERSRQNLIAEGFPGNRIFVTGNPIYEVLASYPVQTKHSAPPMPFALVTLHRAETVDSEEYLRSIIQVLKWVKVSKGLNVVYPVHPHTRKNIEAFGIDTAGLDLRDPMGFHEFIDHQRGAELVLTDSGTVQEECAILCKRVVILRDQTERPETQESGSALVSGRHVQDIQRCVEAALVLQTGKAPDGYKDISVSNKVIKILMSHKQRTAL